MRATLTFNLPEEKEYLFQALVSPNWECAMGGLDHWLRNQIKYGDSKDGKRENILQEARDELYNNLREYNLEWSE